VNYDPSNTIKTYENSDIIIPRYDLGQLVLNEQFMPLIGVDIGFHNSLTANVQYKKARTLTMSFSNNQLTEVEGNEIVVGAGYRIKNLTFNIVSMTGNKNKKTVKNDLVLKLDIGLKRDKTTLRRIDENNSQVSAGQSKLNIYLTGDYQFSTRLSTQVFFKYDTSTPFVSTSFPTSTTFAGLTVRFNLAQ
jgi:cell surface protein SprA